MGLRDLAESRIVIDEDICSGKPRIRGTRVSVADILLALTEGLSYQEIIRNFRSIQVNDIKAAVAYAFCITEGMKLRIASSISTNEFHDVGEMAAITQEDYQDEQNKLFAQALEEQATIQEEITKEKVAQIKAKKIQRNQAPQLDRKEPPKERPYDLLIDISGEESTYVFNDQHGIEQALEMNYDNYLFEKRSDGKQWLTYSGRDGIEIDQAMKRNLLVTYKGLDGSMKEAIFEGYLSSDRQHKVFIQRVDEVTCGRAL